MAVTDALTGLANRAVLMDRLAHALAGRQCGHRDVGVVFVDLDGFKAVNDTRGHAVGDSCCIRWPGGSGRDPHR